MEAIQAISFEDMCRNEGAYFQRGMYFRIRPDHSVLLSSGKADSDYSDMVDPEAEMMIYEGHNVHRSRNTPLPQLVDQPEFHRNGNPTQNHRFLEAALAYQEARERPEAVRVYRKLGGGLWANLGIYYLVDGWREFDGRRLVFKFKLRRFPNAGRGKKKSKTRSIPARVRAAVWNRDHGACVVCGKDEDIHFDHIIPISKGGDPISSKNIQILCAKHNLEKSDKL